MRKLLIAGCIALSGVLAAGSAWAKLPPPTEEQKAKAEEAKAKAAEAAKKEAELLSKAQDRVAERYIKEQQAKGVTVKPTPIATAAPAPAQAAAAPAKKEEKK
ncbi:MAG: formate dehydrogenase [Pseudomonadota bacterium]